MPTNTSQKLERKATLNLGEGGAAPGRGEGGGRAAPQGGVREDDGRVQGEGDPEGRRAWIGAAGCTAHTSSRKLQRARSRLHQR